MARVLDCPRPITRKRFILVPAALVGLVASSCSSGYYRLYSGPALPQEKLAILFTRAPERKRDKIVPGRRGLPSRCPVHIHRMDGQKINGSWRDDSVTVELLPGEHTVEVYYDNTWVLARKYIIPTAWVREKSNEVVTLKFNAKAGQRYLLNASTWHGWDKGEYGWRPQIIDVAGTDVASGRSVQIEQLPGGGVLGQTRFGLLREQTGRTKRPASEVLSQLDVGKSTKADVQSLLGEPSYVTPSDQGGMLWTYTYSELKDLDPFLDFPLGATYDHLLSKHQHLHTINEWILTIVFDKSEVVRDILKAASGGTKEAPTERTTGRGAVEYE